MADETRGTPLCTVDIDCEISGPAEVMHTVVRQSSLTVRMKHHSGRVLRLLWIGGAPADAIDSDILARLADKQHVWLRIDPDQLKALCADGSAVEVPLLLDYKSARWSARGSLTTF